MDTSLDCLMDMFEEPNEESSYIEEDSNLDESSYVEEEDEFEEEYTMKKASSVRPWYQKSRKSMIRMIGSNLMWQSSDRRKRKFRERSIVRMIASRLPLKPSKRAYFEMFVESNRHAMNRAKIFFEENLNTVKAQLPEVGLADMGLFGWTDFDGPASDSKQGVVTRGTLDNSSHSLSSISNISAEDASQPRCLKRGTKLREKEVSEKKITALEDELANLRAQIAMIVSLQEKTTEQAVPVAPPPPPPMVPATPPPPPLPPVIKPRPNLKSNIKKAKAAEHGVPSMTDVLAGLSTVKLRSANVARSPGGTPLKVRSGNQNRSSSQDPADVIANALRKKFAKARRSIGSPCADKENQLSPHGGFSPSPVKSIDSSSFLPITSSPEKGRKHRRRSSTLTGSRIILSPVKEN